jgi:hypothetical protein
VLAVIHAMSKDPHYVEVFPALTEENVQGVLATFISRFEARNGVGRAGLGSLLLKDSRFGLRGTSKDLVYEIAAKLLVKMKELMPDFDYVQDPQNKRRRNN